MNDKRFCVPELALYKCRDIAHSIQEPILKKVALQVLEENEGNFLSIKGSDWQHHNYAGGLVVHTCNVALNAIRMAEFYQDLISMDLVKFCSLMHDVGKLFDYEWQDEFLNNNKISMNQSLLGHGFEGAVYIMNKLQQAYSDDAITVSEDYIKSVITQVSHCIGAHMDGFGACAKQQMFEVLIIGCADKVDAYLEQTIVKEDEAGKAFVLGTGEKFYRASIDASEVMLFGESILQSDLH